MPRSKKTSSQIINKAPNALKTSHKVAVIGAGITGITTAYQLAQRGFEVTIFDRQAYPAMETSYANGGQLSASNAAVWNNWPTVLKAMKWVFTPGAPLLINPKPSWHKLSWVSEFIAAIPKYEKHTIATAELAIKARDVLLQMAHDEDIKFDHEARGILHFCQSEQDLASARKVSALLNKGGLERKELSPQDIKRLEPALTGDFVGGFFTPSDFSGDVHKFTYGLAKACERLGTQLKFNTDVVKIQAHKDGLRIGHKPSNSAGQAFEMKNFDKLVVCAGVHSRRLASLLGDRVNIYPVKGYSITVHLETKADQAAAPYVSLLDEAAKIVTSRLGKDRFRVAGTAEFNGYNKDISAKRIAPLIGWCQKYFPAMSRRSFTSWAGLRPMTPTMMPKVGPGRKPHVFYNTGHGHLGWTLSAATATMIADIVLHSVESQTAGRKVSGFATKAC